MNPILIEIGPITIHSYGFFIAMAFLAGILIIIREAKQRGLPHQIVSDLSFYIILSAIVGSRLLYVLLNPGYFLEHPLQILMFWKGGLVFLGGGLAATAVVIWFLRKHEQPFWDWADAIAPGLALGQAIGRIGCLMAGCCYGKQCDLPWAITFSDPNSLAPVHIALHPTQLYHSLAGLLTFIILMLAKRYLPHKGQLMGLLFVLYSIFRFGIEFFRDDYRGDFYMLSVTQVIAIIVFCAGLIIIKKRSA
jgi:phosphatidylglycerol:prolipoprotein diacylglycerol transferase